MDVLIRLERQQPPAGTVVTIADAASRAAEGKSAVPFAGWLGLLRALSEVLDEPQSDAN